MKRTCLYFLAGLGLQFVLLHVGGTPRLLLMAPGLVFSFLISGTSDTSELSFILGLLLNATIYTAAAFFIEKIILGTKARPTKLEVGPSAGNPEK
jgi:hypothetical protein